MKGRSSAGERSRPLPAFAVSVHQVACAVKPVQSGAVSRVSWVNLTSSPNHVHRAQGASACISARRQEQLHALQLLIQRAAKGGIAGRRAGHIAE